MKDNEIKVCFEYQLISSEIKFYTDLIDEKKFGTPEFVKHIYSLLNLYYEGIAANLLYYEDYFLPELCKWDILVSSDDDIKVLLFLISNQNVKKDIHLYISKNFIINDFLLMFLKIFKINYRIIKVGIEIESLLPININKIRRKSYYSLRVKIKNIVIFFINIYKKKCTDMIYFQGYHSNKDLMNYLNEHFITDIKYNKIISRDKPRLLVYPTMCAKYRKTYNISNDYKINISDDVDSLIVYIFRMHYLSLIDELKCLIKNLIKKLRRFNIANVILMHDLPMVHHIISTYIKKNNGKVMLYGHGPREYSYLGNSDVLKNIDGIFCWSDYEMRLYKHINNKLQLIPTGYPIFNSLLEKQNQKIIKKIEESIITILPPVRLIEVVNRLNNDIDDLISIVKILLRIGVKKENIIVKLHPGYLNNFFFNDILSDYLDADSIKKEESMIDVVKKSDIIIGPMSTSAYEAIFLNTPYIYFNKYSDFYTQHILLDLDIPTFNKVEDLEEILSNFKYPSFDLLQKKMLYKNDYYEVAQIIKNTFGVTN